MADSKHSDLIDTRMEHIQVSSRELTPGIHELRIVGSLDWSNFAKVESVMEGIFRKGVYKLVINLRETRYISSAGFGCFISSLDTAMKNSGDIVFTATPPEIKNVFNILGLCNILRFAENEEEAIRQLSQKAL